MSWFPAFYKPQIINHYPPPLPPRNKHKHWHIWRQFNVQLSTYQAIQVSKYLAVQCLPTYSYTSVLISSCLVSPNQLHKCLNIQLSSVYLPSYTSVLISSCLVSTYLAIQCPNIQLSSCLPTQLYKYLNIQLSSCLPTQLYKYLNIQLSSVNLPSYTSVLISNYLATYLAIQVS